MAQRNAAELLAGAVVLAAALGFLGYAVANTGRVQLGGYPLHAHFTAIDGLGVGADVRIAGVKVGSVTATRVDLENFEADVDFTLAGSIKLPKDSSAAVTSDGLLGGKYLQLQPGGDEQTIPPGGTISITQPSINIEQLLGRFIFSMGNLGSAQKPGAAAKPEGGAK